MVANKTECHVLWNDAQPEIALPTHVNKPAVKYIRGKALFQCIDNSFKLSCY